MGFCLRLAEGNKKPRILSGAGFGSSVFSTRALSRTSAGNKYEHESKGHVFHEGRTHAGHRQNAVVENLALAVRREHAFKRTRPFGGCQRMMGACGWVIDIRLLHIVLRDEVA